MSKANISKIYYWIFNYMPQWEAASQEVKLLSESFRRRYGTRIISMNMKSASRKTTLLGRDKHLRLPYCLPLLPILLRMARSAQINHIVASAAERVLTPRLARLGNVVLTISKDVDSISKIEANIDALKRVQYIIVESERHYDLMEQLGVPSKRLRLIYPGLVQQPFVAAPGSFTLLFASSPRHAHDFLPRGIHLMLRASERLPDVRFRFVWRGWHYQRLMSLIHDSAARNVDVCNGYVEDMSEMYSKAHAVILPAVTESGLKPCPHSAIHSLAHGKPVLVSRHVSIAPIVERNKCGVVFDADIDSLCRAVVELRSNYDRYQANAHMTVASTFSQKIFLDRHKCIYSSISGEHV